MVYYPMAVQEQEAYKWIARTSGDMTESVRLSREVLSLPMHTELTEEMQAYTTEQIREFFQVVQ